MTRFQTLLNARRNEGFRLGLGLDVEFDRLPPSFASHYANNPSGRSLAIEEFTQEAALAVSDLAAAFKPNLAFAEGEPNDTGEKALREALYRINLNCPEIPMVIDGKRGDIGNSAKGYAKHVFGPTTDDHHDADATTIAPYMGFEDSMDVFVDNYPDRTHFILCRTSNKGAKDLQDRLLIIDDSAEIDELLRFGATDFATPVVLPDMRDAWALPQYLWVAFLAARRWNRHGNVGLVVGATAPEQLELVCRIVAGTGVQLLIPGSKTQGGKLDVIIPILRNTDCMNQATIFASRAALYPEQGTDGEDWADQIATRFEALHQELSHLLI